MNDVIWNKPNTVPSVVEGEVETFWIAVLVETKGFIEEVVFEAKYINMPLKSDSKRGISDEHFLDENGYPITCVGWYSAKEHAEFCDCYEPLVFDETCKLLGWTDYKVPEFRASWSDDKEEGVFKVGDWVELVYPEGIDIRKGFKKGQVFNVECVDEDGDIVFQDDYFYADQLKHTTRPEE